MELFVLQQKEIFLPTHICSEKREPASALRLFFACQTAAKDRATKKGLLTAFELLLFPTVRTSGQKKAEWAARADVVVSWSFNL